MGWCKYFEDNVSIYIGRMIMRSKSVRLSGDQPDSAIKPKGYHSQPRSIHSDKSRVKINLPAIDEYDRHGLELRFIHDVDRSTEKNLRLNRWWHKRGKNTWLNNNTKVNREFADYFVNKNLAQLEVIANKHTIKQKLDTDVL